MEKYLLIVVEKILQLFHDKMRQCIVLQLNIRLPIPSLISLYNNGNNFSMTGYRYFKETRMFRNKLNMNNLRLSIVDVSPKSYEVRFLRIAKTQIAAKDEDQQNMDCGLYWNWQIQQRRHLSASLILTTLAR